MSKKWAGLQKVAEECNELTVELMKLSIFPSGKHPGRRRSVILSTEDECGDVLAAVNYFIDRHNLDRKRIEQRVKSKYKKFSGWWGIPALRSAGIVKTIKKIKKQVVKSRP